MFVEIPTFRGPAPQRRTSHHVGVGGNNHSNGSERRTGSATIGRTATPTTQHGATTANRRVALDRQRAAASGWHRSVDQVVTCAGEYASDFVARQGPRFRSRDRGQNVIDAKVAPWRPARCATDSPRPTVQPAPIVTATGSPVTLAMSSSVIPSRRSRPFRNP